MENTKEEPLPAEHIVSFTLAIVAVIMSILAIVFAAGTFWFITGLVALMLGVLGLVTAYFKYQRHVNKLNRTQKVGNQEQ